MPKPSLGPRSVGTWHQVIGPAIVNVRLLTAEPWQDKLNQRATVLLFNITVSGAPLLIHTIAEAAHTSRAGHMTLNGWCI
jgi:hypothetical protein